MELTEDTEKIREQVLSHTSQNNGFLMQDTRYS